METGTSKDIRKIAEVFWVGGITIGSIVLVICVGGTIHSIVLGGPFETGVIGCSIAVVGVLSCWVIASILRGFADLIQNTNDINEKMGQLIRMGETKGVTSNNTIPNIETNDVEQANTIPRTQVTSPKYCKNCGQIMRDGVCIYCARLQAVRRSADRSTGKQ